MKIAWIVKGDPVKADYTNSYSFTRFYAPTIAAVARILGATQVDVIGTGDASEKYLKLKQGGDCHLFKQSFGPGTSVNFITWASADNNYDIGFAGVFSDKSTQFKKLLKTLSYLAKKCKYFIYLDSDHELTDDPNWILSKDIVYTLKNTDDVSLRIDEVWYTEGPAAYSELLDEYGFRHHFCPYIHEPLDYEYQPTGPFHWVFMKNSYNWQGKITDFLSRMGGRVCWYTSPLPAKAKIENEYLKKFGVTTRRARTWSQADIPNIFSEGKFTFWASRPINRLTSKMSEALQGGCITPLPLLNPYRVPEPFYGIYRKYAMQEEYIIDAESEYSLNKIMLKMSFMNETERRTMYNILIAFHNAYFNPKNLIHIGSRIFT